MELKQNFFNFQKLHHLCFRQISVRFSINNYINILMN